MEAHAHQAPQPRPAEVPPVADGLSEREKREELDLVRRLGKVMDEIVGVPGTNVKVGLDAIVGLIPGVGDVSTAAVGAYMLRAAQRLGVPAIVQVRMLFNILIDTLLGLVPVLGDFLDVLYRSNAKNAALVERAVENREATGRSSWLMVVGVFLAFVLIIVGGIVGTVFLVRWAWNAAG